MLASSPTGVELAPFARRYNLLPAELAEQLRAADVEGLPLRTGVLGLRPAQVTGLCREILTAVAAWHDRYPDSLGPTEPELARLPGPRLAPELRHALVGRLLGQGKLARTGFSVHQPEHRPRLSPPDQALLNRITALQREAGLRPPIVGDLALSLGLDKAELLVFLEHAHHLGLLVRVAPNRYFLPLVLTRLARIAVELASESPRGSFDARQYRDRSGIGRNLTIQVLEYLDRAGVTAFIRGERRIQPGYTGPESDKDLDQA
jgi:selenocysteine-specific elongation factor